MEQKERKKSDVSRSGIRRTIVFAVAFVVLLALAAAGISILRGAHFRRSTAELSPAPVPGAAWNATQPPSEGETPEPTAEPTEAPTEAPTLQPFAKTEIFVDGRSVAVIASREAAEELLLSVENYFGSIGDIPADAVTEPDCKVELWPAADSAQSMSYDSAYAYLTGEDTPLRYRSVANYVEERIIPHTETVYEDPKLMRGLRIVKVYGRDGLERTVYRTVYLNGVKQEPEAAETYTVIGPVNGETAVGTRDYGDDFVLTPDFGSNPVAAYSFDFISPVKGEVDKFFGPYDGGFHHGIDIACGEGEEIRAACEGRVVSVMERGAYGLLVEIEHGNSVSTRYAKLSSACVSIGDAVSQGALLGYAEQGAEQAHLHFELRIGGTAYNPLKILSAGDIIG